MPTYEVDVQGSTYEVDAPDPNTAWRWANSTYKKSLEQTANKEVSIGQSSKDLAGSFVSGVGGLAQLPGQLYGLATGNFGGTEFGKNISDYGEGLKSEQLKAEEKLRNLKIQEAERKGGQLSAAGTAIKETFTHPRLLANFLTEQVPQLIPALLTGGGTAYLTAAGLTAKEAATLVASGMAKEAAEIAAKKMAAKQAAVRGAAAAKGTGAIQQGADAGAQVYEDAYKKLKENDVSDEEAAQRALSLARGSGASAAVISVLAQNLPGAGAIENLAAGVPGKFKGRLANLAAGAAGEAVGEAAEEGGGKFAQNVAMREVDPNQKLLAGVGEAAGMGAAGGIGLGGVAGALHKPGHGETQSPETQPQTSPAGTQPPPPPASSEQKAQERAQYVEGLANSLLETGVSKEEARRLAEEKVAQEEANDAQYEAEQQAAQQAKQQEAPSDVQQPNAEPAGASVPMASEPSARAPTPGAGGPESTRVVSTAAPSGQPNARESQQRAPLTSQQTTEGNINGAEATQTQQTETQKQEAPTPATDQPITSFTTSQGSTYQVDADGKTSRTKNSKGAGQGETYAPHPALYVSPEAQQRVLDDKNAGGSNRSIRLGYHADGMFHPITDLTQIPQGAIPAVAVQDKTNNKVVGIYEASTKPQVGLHPIEKLYTEDGNSSTHVGNQIVDVRQGNVETPQAELTDEEKQNLQAELDEEQNKPTQTKPLGILEYLEKRDELVRQMDEAHEEMSALSEKIHELGSLRALDVLGDDGKPLALDENGKYSADKAKDAQEALRVELNKVHAKFDAAVKQIDEFDAARQASKQKATAKTPFSQLTEDQKRTVQAELDAEYNDAVVKKSISTSIGKPDKEFHKFKTATEAIKYVAKTGNVLQKLFAKRLASALEGVKFVVVEGENLPPELGIPANEWNGATGAFVRDGKGGTYIVVRGIDTNSSNHLYQGVNNITVLHEALHAALQQKIDAGLKGLDTGLTKAIKSLEKTMDLARERAQAQLDDNKLPLLLHDLLLDGKVFDDPHEFVSYAMTDPKFQEWLMKTPGHIVKTLYNQFVNNVRQFFNMSANSVNALSDIINITDQLLSAKATENTKAQTGRVLKQAQGKLTEAFKKWFGNSKVVDENGNPFVVYRGVVGLEKNGIAESALNAEARKGYAAFGSSSPYVASSYANPEDEFGETGAVTPLYIKADKLIEFPVTVDKYGGRRFDYFEMDRRAQTLPAGTVLVARQVIDIGPRAKSSVDPEKLYSYYSDIYAWNNGTSVKSATGNNGEYDINNPSIKFSKAPKVTKASATEEKLGKGNFADDLRELSTLTKLRDQSEFVDNAMEFFGFLKEGAIRQLLVSLQTSAVVEWARRLGMDHIVDADKHMRDMAGEKNKRMNQMLPKFNKLVELRKKSLAQYKQLANIMHYTTLLSRDPTNAKVLAGDKVLQRMWGSLDENTKKLYEEIRDHYIEQHTAYYNVLTQQIEESGLEEPEKSKVIAAIKQVYETGRTMYPYFPLMRYGQYWVRIGKGVGREFHMFENKQDRNRFMKQRAKQMGKTWKLAVSDGDMDVGDDLKSARINEEASATGQLKTLFAAINNGAIPVTDDFGNVVSDKSVVDAETLKSQIYQMFLQTLPDRNFRKQFIMRKGIAGFSGDIARNFVTNGINMANQLTRIEYGGKAMKELELAKDALQGDPDKLKKGEFLAEMAERITMQVRPDADDTVLHKAANLANTASYLWLMTSVKTAAAQLSSVPIFVGPVLTANHGFNPAKVAGALTKSLAIFGSNGIIKKNADGTESYEFPSMLNSGLMELTGDEKLAAEYMIERGITQNTNTYELVGRRNTSTAEAESSTSKVKNAVVGVMTGLFHHTERMVREITFMTSYRLYREDLGQSPDAHQRALELAEKETNEALGAYSAYERPRGVLQTAQRKVVINAHGPLGKSLLQFKMFATFATTFFVRNAYRMFAGLDAKDRTQAMTKVMGSLLMSLSLAGYVGVPGISMAIGAVQGMMNGLKALGGDDDDEEELLEDRDWEFWFRNKWLPETFGETAGRVLNRGLLAETTGYDITSSLSFQNMWFPEMHAQATAQATMQDYLFSIAGPSISMGAKQLPQAIDYYNKGEIMRGMETLMPAFVKGAFTAERYSREGATTASNLPIKKADEFTAGQLFMQSLGFASTDLVNQREFIYKMQGEIIKVQRERAQLLDRLGRAETGGDEKDTEKVMEDIDKYNAKNSFLPIDNKAISQSLTKREKAMANAQRGMPYNKHFEGQYDESLERSLRGFEK